MIVDIEIPGCEARLLPFKNRVYQGTGGAPSPRTCNYIGSIIDRYDFETDVYLEREDVRPNRKPSQPLTMVLVDSLNELGNTCSYYPLGSPHRLDKRKLSMHYTERDIAAYYLIDAYFEVQKKESILPIDLIF